MARLSESQFRLSETDVKEAARTSEGVRKQTEVHLIEQGRNLIFNYNIL